MKAQPPTNSTLIVPSLETVLLEASDEHGLWVAMFVPHLPSPQKRNASSFLSHRLQSVVPHRWLSVLIPQCAEFCQSLGCGEHH